MKYYLEDTKEFDRLEKQATHTSYSLDEELKHLTIPREAKILDAGCGSGLLSRYLVDKEKALDVEACDFSDLRIQQAKNYSKGKYSDIKYQKADLLNLPYEDEAFDIIISRFVFEYLPSPVDTVKELKRVLKKGGTLYLIDLDGVFLNYWTQNKQLNKQIKKLKENIEIDLYVGRKLAGFIHQAGFKSIEWDATIHKFNQDHLIKEERENNSERLQFAKENLLKVFQDEKETEHFSMSYLNEMACPKKNVMFFNKFASWGTK